MRLQCPNCATTIEGPEGQTPPPCPNCGFNGQVPDAQAASATYQPVDSGYVAPSALANDPVFATALATSQYPNAGPPPQKGLAVASLVVGIASIPLAGILGIAAGITAIILGFVHSSRSRQAPHLYAGHGMARAGIVCGIIGIVVSLLALVFLLPLLLR